MLLQMRSQESLQQTLHTTIPVAPTSTSMLLRMSPGSGSASRLDSAACAMTIVEGNTVKYLMQKKRELQILGAWYSDGETIWIASTLTWMLIPCGRPSPEG